MAYHVTCGIHAGRPCDITCQTAVSGFARDNHMTEGDTPPLQGLAPPKYRMGDIELTLIKLTSPYRGSLEENSVVNVADEAIRFGGSRSLSPQEVEDSCSQLHMLTVLNELAQMGQTCRQGERKGRGVEAGREEGEGVRGDRSLTCSQFLAE